MSTCAYCKKPKGNIACGGCDARYCGEDCADAHWPEHYAECIGVDFGSADLPPDVARKIIMETFDAENLIPSLDDLLSKRLVGQGWRKAVDTLPYSFVNKFPKREFSSKEWKRTIRFVMTVGWEKAQKVSFYEKLLKERSYDDVKRFAYEAFKQKIDLMPEIVATANTSLIEALIKIGFPPIGKLFDIHVANGGKITVTAVQSLVRRGYGNILRRALPLVTLTEEERESLFRLAQERRNNTAINLLKKT